MVTETKVELTCEICGITSEDVKEYPTHKDGHDTTEYQCKDFVACLDRKERSNGIY